MYVARKERGFDPDGLTGQENDILPTILNGLQIDLRLPPSQ